MKFGLVLLAGLSLGISNAFAASVDCSEAYAGKSAKCEVIPCSQKYKEVIGTWAGPFEAYDINLKKFRPYHNQVTYSENECLKNIENGDTFIIGRMKDSYSAFDGLPAEIKPKLLITGRTADDKPFMKTVDPENGSLVYEMVYTNEMAGLSIWKLSIPAAGTSPEMTFTIIDGRDNTEPSSHKRDVTITMIVGPNAEPLWQGVVARGYHRLQK